MPPSESEDEGLDDAEFDRTTEGDDEIDEDILDALEGDLAAAAAAEEGTEADDDSLSDDDSDNSDDDEPYYGQSSQKQLPQNAYVEGPADSMPPATGRVPPRESPQIKSPSPVERILSPAEIRKMRLLADISWPRSFTVEAVCAIPHPEPTHCLASSLCMTHLLTGSEDGYIRDYDVFSAVNGKIFLTAPQRHHCGVMEGLMKAAQIRCWWENPLPLDSTPPNGSSEAPSLCPVYCLAMQSDALWTLAGSRQGHISLFTVRHDPGRLCHVMKAHRGPVSALALQHDEMGFFSAGWDGDALQWDLNTGQVVRNFAPHGSQLTAIGVRPLTSHYDGHHWNSPPPAEKSSLTNAQSDWPMESRQGNLVHSVQASEQARPGEPSYGQMPPAAEPMDVSQQQYEDSKSDTSYDPLFDEPDADGEPDNEDNAVAPSDSATAFGTSQLSTFSSRQPPASSFMSFSASQTQSGTRSAAAPKNAPPILDPVTYTTFSPDVLMTASIDGQVILWDTRVHSPGTGVGRLWMSEKTPPWCMSACWSADGAQIYAGRRNGTIDIWDVRQTGRTASGIPKILKTLRNPISSGVVSCVVAFPDGRHLACASNDNIRLWNVAEANEPDASGKMKSGVQFKIIPGHHGGFISQMLVDPAARFLVSASGNRGWHGESTRTVFVHEIKHVR